MLKTVPARFLIYLLLIGCLAGCDVSEDNEPDFETILETEAAFGVRALYGINDSDGFDEFLRLALAVIYDENDMRASLDTTNTLAFEINGITASSDSVLFSYEAGEAYRATIGLNDERIETTVTAPSISEIAFKELPDSVAANQPVTIQWAYPDGELNDGALVVTAGDYSSGLLDPETTSHTIPANTFERNGPESIVIVSVRYTLFTGLRNPRDLNIQFITGLDHRGSFFGVFVAQTRTIYVFSGDAES